MITELQKKIMEFSILDADEWVSNPFVKDFMIPNRISACLEDMKKHWLPILEERNIAIPDYPAEPAVIILKPITEIYADRILELKNSLEKKSISLEDYKTEIKAIEDEYKILLEQNQAENKANRDVYLAEVKVIDEEIATLIFAQPDYKSRAEREAKPPEELLQEAKERKIAEVEIYKNQQFAKPLLVRASNGSENPDYYLKPSPDYNIFLAGSSMSENETKEWRAFDIDGNKLNKENGDPLTLEVTKSELMSVSNHYEFRKTQEYNQRDLKVARINKLTTIEEVEVFDVNQIILP